jgi:mRNA interferase MazF
VRGEVYKLPAAKNPSGHEQRGARYAVVVQSDDLPLSTWLVCPTSASAADAPWRPEVDLGDIGESRVMTEHLCGVDPQRLGKWIANLTRNEMDAVDQALRIVLAL